MFLWVIKHVIVLFIFSWHSATSLPCLNLCSLELMLDTFLYLPFWFLWRIIFSVYICGFQHAELCFRSIFVGSSALIHLTLKFAIQLELFLNKTMAGLSRSMLACLHTGQLALLAILVSGGIVLQILVSIFSFLTIGCLAEICFEI